MAFDGPTILIDCSQGGLVMSDNPDILPPTAMVEGTKNLNLHKGTRDSRGGTRHFFPNAFPGSQPIIGAVEFRNVGGQDPLVTYSNDGVVRTNESIILGTLTFGAYPDFEIFNNKLYIVNGSDPLQTWDGLSATLTAVGSVPNDWLGANQPRWIERHGRKNFRRLYAGGTVNTPNTLYISEVDGSNDADFSQANTKRINIETGDSLGLVGAIEFYKQLLLFSRNRTYILDDDNTDLNLWGYNSAPWFGGAAHNRLITKTENDVIVMTHEGEIYSILAVQESHDLRASSIARPALIDIWLRKNADFNKIKKFFSVYDPQRRAIRFWIVRNGQSDPDTCLLFFIDRPPNQAWMIHDNLFNSSGYKAYSATSFKNKATSQELLLTGSHDGRMWQLETSQANDNGLFYWAGFKTPKMFGENIRIAKNWTLGWLVSKEVGTHTMKIITEVDGERMAQKEVSMHAGSPVLGSTFILGESNLGSTPLVAQNDFEIGNQGKRISLEVFNNTTNIEFSLNSMMVDYINLGKGIS